MKAILINWKRKQKNLIHNLIVPVRVNEKS